MDSKTSLSTGSTIFRFGLALMAVSIATSASGQGSEMPENTDVLLNNSVLPEGKGEVIWFGILTVQDLTTVRDNEAVLEKSDRWGMTHFLQFNYGISDKLRLNAGIDVL